MKAARRAPGGRGQAPVRGKAGGETGWRPRSGRQPGASRTAGRLAMMQGELRKCHPNGGIHDRMRQSSHHLSIPAWTRSPGPSVLSQLGRGASPSRTWLSSSPCCLANPVLSLSLQGGTVVIYGGVCVWGGQTARAPLQSRQMLPAFRVRGTMETAADSSKSLATSFLTPGSLLLYPPPPPSSGRLPCPSLGTHSLWAPP